ncbi:MAG: hypothetical protein DRP35_10410 [Candidatus Zixiibacteriota bacterium]|nr:MAG: hypothetical protein DRP35_10410 [candidate division Zixibacteria bacterium]
MEIKPKSTLVTGKQKKMTKDKFCITLSENNFTACYQAAKDAELIELRLDLVTFTDSELKKLFALKTKFIATCRQNGKNNTERIKKLKDAIDAGVDFIDIEIDSDFQEKMIMYARDKNCQIIISYHNFTRTPSLSELQKIIDVGRKFNPWKIKIVTMANTPQDLSTVLSLYRNNTNLIAFCMGEKGKISRLASLFLGADFTFVSPLKGKEVAEGQMDINTMVKLIEELKL